MLQNSPCLNCPARYRSVEGDVVIDCHNGCTPYEEFLQQCRQMRTAEQATARADADFFAAKGKLQTISDRANRGKRLTLNRRNRDGRN